MTSRKTWASSVLAVATSVMLGCSSVPSTTTSTTPQETNTATEAQVPFTLDEGTLTAEETGLTNEAYTLQQWGGYSNYWFTGRRCQWFWVPSRWSYPYFQSWQGGRWVFICNRRQIPWWWYPGPYAGAGAFSRIAPRFRPSFPGRFRDFDRRGGRGPGGPGGPGGGRGPGFGGGDDDGPRGGGRGPGGPGMGGGDDDGPRGGGRGPRNPGPDND